MEKKTRNFFVSYHHGNAQKYVKALRKFKQGMKVADYSLKEDISEYTDDEIYTIIRNKMRACSVTVVLIGERTGYRKWIDWELWASLRAYKNSRNFKRSFRPKGLLAIYLPTTSHSVPERLQTNIDSGYAVSMSWKNIERDFESKINYAIWKRDHASHEIKNHLERFDRNAFNFLGFKI
ncbi:TIR domain-containing protein [Zunongwangia sp. SCSIO 43204]|uniref:TIR domain-containing protein n=1 Tax=Zunongwangia sp. SCSIO 43204 TaxID=2779359 RepID=UPI001CAA03FD|nr:TIR domain-containing protein [Zunongwangia sp. SCSIO 43204]UAB82853.1 TIR domain-containing protein [Zunongwangia sp. SCSIO 43204]